ncbi:arginine/serine-rich protein PNISR [Anopheles maculipalpis]|uniref:arginine/serine-rich protein PNISR n=1 Tax=Anopheles maculipalpis TaxID=1496333 RepID=UPI0021598F1F|nr:arginine/serine-rich protein PNISR [Anopheles maculipalpis]
MMNRHGASNSTRSEDPGQLFSALMSDNGPHQGTFVPGSNAFSLAHYQNMPNDQVDWAALAQQWIKMRETWIQPMPSLIPSAPPPPSFDRDAYDGGTAHTAVGDTSHPANRSVGSVVDFEEQGEAPMEVEREDDGDMPVPPTPPNISSDWSTSGDDTWRTWSWPSTVPSASTPSETRVPQTLPNNQKHTDQQQTSAGGAVSTIATPVPGITTPSPSAAAAIALWQAKNSHLFQTGGYPKDSTAVRTPQTPAPPRRVFSTQPKPVRLPGLMDREIKLGLGSVTGADVQRVETKENSYGATVPGGSSTTINEEKRMMLPAWIREGLEKMEREKQQKLKREQEYRQREEKLSSQQNLHTLALSPTREERIPPLGVQQLEQEDLQPPPQPTSPLKEQDVEQTTKKILTEVFMETTNEVLLSIAKEELSKVRMRKAKQAATSNVGHATYTRGLGLGIYGDSDEDEDEEEEEEEKPTNEVSKTAPSGTYANSDLDSGNNSDDDDSDTEAMRKMMDKIRTRQQSFKSTASQIEKWLGDVSDPMPNGGELNQKPQTSDTEGSDEEEEHEEGARYDGMNSDLEGESPSRQGKPTTGNGFGTAQYTLFTGRQTEKPTGSQENAVRKRRDKRVSRFSDPRDTVRTTHITHVSILSNPTETVRSSTKPLESNVAVVVAAAAAASAPVSISTVRPKQPPAPEAKPRQQQSINAYIQQLQSYQTIFSISAAGNRTAPSKPNETDDTRRNRHNSESEPGSHGNDGGDSDRKLHYYHDRKKSYAEENESGGTSRSRRDDGSDSHRKRYRDQRSHSRSSRGTRSSGSRSGSADSRSSRCTLSPNSHASDHRRSSSSSKRPRYHRDRRSSERRSRSSGSSSRRHHRSKHSRSPSRSRSSSKYSSRRRF